MTENPFADLLDKPSRQSSNPFADLVPARREPANHIGGGLAALGSGVVSSFGSTLSGLGYLTGSETLESGGEFLGRQAEGLMDFVPESYRDNFVYSNILPGLGSLASYIGPGLLARGGVRAANSLAGRAPLARGMVTRGERLASFGTAGAMAGPAGVDEQLQRVRQYIMENPELGLTEEDFSGRIAMGAIGGLVQIANMGRFIDPIIPRKARGVVMSDIIRRSLEGGISEAIVESGGNIIQNILERSYNVDRGLLDDTLERGGTGGIVGFLGALAMSPFTRGPKRITKKDVNNRVKNGDDPQVVLQDVLESLDDSAMARAAANGEFAVDVELAGRLGFAADADPIPVDFRSQSPEDGVARQQARQQARQRRAEGQEPVYQSQMQADPSGRFVPGELMARAQGGLMDDLPSNPIMREAFERARAGRPQTPFEAGIAAAESLAPAEDGAQQSQAIPTQEATQQAEAAPTPVADRDPLGPVTTAELPQVKVDGQWVPLPDARLKRAEFRRGLRQLEKELIPGGGVALVPTGQYGAGMIGADGSPIEGSEIKTKSPSLNPDWFKDLGRELHERTPGKKQRRGKRGEKQSALTMKQVNRAVDAALAGRKLGVRQEIIIRRLLDQHQLFREMGPDGPHGPGLDVGEALARGRNLRRAARGQRTDEQVQTEAERVESEREAARDEMAGQQFAEQDYLAELDAEGRTLAELAWEASQSDPAAVEAALSDNLSDIESARSLWTLIKEGQQNDQQQTRTRPAEDRAAPTEPVGERAAEAATSGRRTTREPERDLAGERPAESDQAQAVVDQERQSRVDRSPEMIEGEGELFAGQRPPQTDMFGPKQVEADRAQGRPADARRTERTDQLNARLRRFAEKRGESFDGQFVEVRPTGEMADLTQMIERAFGRKVVIVRSEGGTGSPVSFNGLVLASDPNTIYLNEASTRPLLSVFGHEWAHTLERSDPALYKQLRDAVVERMNDRAPKHAERLQKLHRGEISAGKLEGEFVADAVGDTIMDPVFWDMLNERSPSFTRRLLNNLRQFINRALGRLTGERPFGMDRYVKDIETLRTTLADVVERHQAARNVETAEAFREGVKPDAAAERPTGDSAPAGDARARAELADQFGRIPESVTVVSTPAQAGKAFENMSDSTAMAYDPETGQGFVAMDNAGDQAGELVSYVAGRQGNMAESIGDAAYVELQRLTDGGADVTGVFRNPEMHTHPAVRSAVRRAKKHMADDMGMQNVTDEMAIMYLAGAAEASRGTQAGTSMTDAEANKQLRRIDKKMIMLQKVRDCLV